MNYEKAQEGLVDMPPHAGEWKNPAKIQNQNLGDMTSIKLYQLKIQISLSREEPSLPKFLAHTTVLLIIAYELRRRISNLQFHRDSHGSLPPQTLPLYDFADSDFVTWYL